MEWVLKYEVIFVLALVAQAGEGDSWAGLGSLAGTSDEDVIISGDRHSRVGRPVWTESALRMMGSDQVLNFLNTDINQTPSTIATLLPLITPKCLGSPTYFHSALQQPCRHEPRPI